MVCPASSHQHYSHHRLLFFLSMSEHVWWRACWEKDTDTPTHMYTGNGENYKNELLFTSQRSQETKRYIQNLCLRGLGLLHTYRETNEWGGYRHMQQSSSQGNAWFAGRRLLIRCLIGPRCHHLWILILMSNKNDPILLSTAHSSRELLTTNIRRRIPVIFYCRFSHIKVPLLKPCRCVGDHHACRFVWLVCTRVWNKTW